MKKINLVSEHVPKERIQTRKKLTRIPSRELISESSPERLTEAEAEAEATATELALVEELNLVEDDSFEAELVLADELEELDLAVA